MHIGIHVKYPLLLEYSRQIFEKIINTKFHENPSSGSRDVPCGRTDYSEYRCNQSNSAFEWTDYEFLSKNLVLLWKHLLLTSDVIKDVPPLQPYGQFEQILLNKEAQILNKHLFVLCNALQRYTSYQYYTNRFNNHTDVSSPKKADLSNWTKPVTRLIRCVTTDIRKHPVALQNGKNANRKKRTSGFVSL